MANYDALLRQLLEIETETGIIKEDGSIVLKNR